MDTFLINKYFILFIGSDVDKEVGILSHGKYFGELALLKEDTRQATVTAMSPGVECLVLDRGWVIKSLWLGSIAFLENENLLMEPLSGPSQQFILYSLSHSDEICNI